MVHVGCWNPSGIRSMSASIRAGVEEGGNPSRKETQGSMETCDIWGL